MSRTDTPSSAFTNTPTGPAHLLSLKDRNGWAATRMFYPNLFRAYLKFLEACFCDPHSVKYYAKIELENLFRFQITPENFKRPHTAGYTSKQAYEKLLGIKIDNIRDNPDILFEEIDVTTTSAALMLIHEWKRDGGGPSIRVFHSHFLYRRIDEPHPAFTF